MKLLTMGVIGHVDHGKTALVRALTGMETDRLAEEKRRGISIALGFAALPLSGGQIDLIDMPGHERFVRTMVAGATGIRAVLLVVSAVEGVRAQTREHVEIAGLLGIRTAIIALTKCDLADGGVTAGIGQEAARLLTANGMTAVAAVPTSATTGSGIDTLRTTLASVLDGGVVAEEKGLVHLPVDRAFAIDGFGTVVTGTLQRGRLSVGEEVELLPAGRRVRVRGIQRHGAPLAAAPPGGRTAVNLRGVGRDEVGPGMTLATPDLLAASEWLDVDLRLLPSAARPLPNGQRLILLAATQETAVRVRLLDRDMLMPGGTAPAQLRCARPIALPAREPFILRHGSPERTVAGGLVVDPVATRQRRGAVGTLTRMDRLRRLSPRALAGALLTDAGAAGVPLTTLARLTGHAPSWVLSWQSDLGAVAAGDLLVARTALEQVMDRIAAAVERHHGTTPSSPGLPLDELPILLGDGFSAPVIGAAIAALLARGRLERAQGSLHRPGFVPAALMDAGRLDAVEAMMQRAGLSPPDVKELIAQGGREAVRDLLRRGVLVRTHDRVQKRDLLFHRDCLTAAADSLAASFAGRVEGFTVGEAGRALGITRKYSVPLLEHLDSRGFTRRIGDRRILHTSPPAPIRRPR